MEHEHTPGQLKFNGGNPVFLCAGCDRIVWWAERGDPIDLWPVWRPGKRYNEFEEDE